MFTKHHNIYRLICLQLILISFVSGFCTNRIELNDVQRIRIWDKIDVVCTVEPGSKDIIEYPDSTADLSTLIYIQEAHGRLIIRLVDESGNTALPHPLHITVGSLCELENAFDGTVSIEGEIEAENLTIIQTANGQISIDSIKARKLDLQQHTGCGSISLASVECDELRCKVLGPGAITILSGSCNELISRIIGTGAINLAGVTSGNASIRYLGGGSIDCNVADKIKVSGIGTTKINHAATSQICECK